MAPRIQYLPDPVGLEYISLYRNYDSIHEAAQVQDRQKS